MERILCTGSAGFMLSHVANELSKQGHVVVGADNLSGGFMRNTLDHLCFFIDLRDKEATERLVSQFKPTILYHGCASAREIGSLFEPVKSTEDNIVAYVNTLNACIKYGLKKVNIFSSMAVYGNQKPPFTEDMEKHPEDVYGFAKSYMEDITKVLSEIHGFKYTIIRPHNVVGINQSLSDIYRNVFAIWMNRIMHGEKEIYIFGDGEQKRAFSPIEFSLPCYIRCLDADTDSKIYNIGGINPITLNEAAAITLRVMEVEDKVKIVHLPPRPRETKLAYCSFQKSVDELGYKETRSLEECLKDMAVWAKGIGAQPWTKDKLELANDKAPEVWRREKY